MRVRAISLWQPWATLMAIGAKRIETRGYPTKVRGLVAIHAAKRATREQSNTCLIPAFADALAGLYQDAGNGCERLVLPFGAIVAVGELVDCRKITTMENLEQCDAVAGDGSFTAWVSTPSFFKTHILPPFEPELSFGNYEPGRYAWIFEHVRAIEPIPCRGKQGWFSVEIPDGEAQNG